MKISVVTATWNSGTTLRDTIESVLSQSYPDIEHIIVDGASKDNTMDIVREMEPRYNGRLKYISEKDRGIYDAMNKGIQMATGDVIGILNSDDFYTSTDVLEHVAREFANEHLDAVYGDIHFVDDKDLTQCVRYCSSRKFEIWQMRFGFMPVHPSFYCRRRIYRDYGLYDIQFKSAADFECLLRFLIHHRIRTKYLPLDFVTMRTGGMSSSGISSYWTTANETIKACRINGIYSNTLFQLIKLFYKGCDLMIQKFKNCL